MNRFRHFLEYATLSSERKYQLLLCVSWTNMSVVFLESIGQSLMVSSSPLTRLDTNVGSGQIAAKH